MTLGVANKQGNLLDDVTRFCDETLDEQSIYAFLHREREQLFPDEAFADLFDEQGSAFGAAFCRRRGHGAPAPRGSL